MDFVDKKNRFLSIHSLIIFCLLHHFFHIFFTSRCGINLLKLCTGSIGNYLRQSGLSSPWWSIKNNGAKFVSFDCTIQELILSYNMLLSYGTKMAIVSALCEFFIGYIAVWFGRFVWEANGAGLALFFVVFGNLFPAFYRLSGGKGVVTMIGAAAALHPIVAGLLLIVFALSVFATKLVAFGSVAISLLYPLFIKAFANEGLQLAMAVFVTFFVLFAHRHNYRRVQEGKEEKFYFGDYLKKKAEAEDDDK